jgi:hypothetical protein
VGRNVADLEGVALCARDARRIDRCGVERRRLALCGGIESGGETRSDSTVIRVDVALPCRRVAPLHDALHAEAIPVRLHHYGCLR